MVKSIPIAIINAAAKMFLFNKIFILSIISSCSPHFAYVSKMNSNKLNVLNIKYSVYSENSIFLLILKTSKSIPMLPSKEESINNKMISCKSFFVHLSCIIRNTTQKLIKYIIICIKGIPPDLPNTITSMHPNAPIAKISYPLTFLLKHILYAAQYLITSNTYKITSIIFRTYPFLPVF